MKIYQIIGLAVLAIFILGGIVYGVRAFSNAITPVVLVSPKEGVTCATMVTGNGAAISCWKD